MPLTRTSCRQQRWTLEVGHLSQLSPTRRSGRRQSPTPAPSPQSDASRTSPKWCGFTRGSASTQTGCRLPWPGAQSRRRPRDRPTGRPARRPARHHPETGPTEWRTLMSARHVEGNVVHRRAVSPRSLAGMTLVGRVRTIWSLVLGSCLYCLAARLKGRLRVMGKHRAPNKRLRRLAIASLLDIRGVETYQRVRQEMPGPPRKASVEGSFHAAAKKASRVPEHLAL